MPKQDTPHPIDAACNAMGPFAAFAAHYVDDRGWTDGEERRRVDFSFEASDFRTLLQARAALSEYRAGMTAPVAWRYEDFGMAGNWYARFDSRYPSAYGIQNVTPLYAASPEAAILIEENGKLRRARVEDLTRQDALRQALEKIAVNLPGTPAAMIASDALVQTGIWKPDDADADQEPTPSGP